MPQNAHESSNPSSLRARTMLSGLIFACPHGGNPTDCQFHAIRNQSVRKRVNWVTSLSDAQCVELYERHRGCFSKKSIWGHGAGGSASDASPQRSEIDDS